MSIQITDCTIRDGGYLLDKNSDPVFVRNIMKGLSESRIDFVETGYLQTKVNGESLVYNDQHDASKYLPENRNNTEFLGFCDNSRYSPDKMDDYDGSSFKWLRISFGRHEIEQSLEFCLKAQEKGYIVQFNPMDAIGYEEDEWKRLLKKVNDITPGSFSIVDTFGSMYLDDLERIFNITNELLDDGIRIGLHSHDNLGLSNALAETLIELSVRENRDVIVDGSLNGMGRGAGNACTELLASYINKKHNGRYDISKMLETIESNIVPIRNKIKWGYDLPMFICGTEHSHVDNVYHLLKNKKSISDIYGIIRSLPQGDRTRYGNNYSKNDFTALDDAVERYKGE